MEGTIEMLGIVLLVKDATGIVDDNIYYEELPAGFKIPSAGFDGLQIIPGTDSLNTGLYTHIWPLNIFAGRSSAAQVLAQKILNKIHGKRSRIPLYETVTDPDTHEDILRLSGKSFQVRDLMAQKVGEGVYQIPFKWDVAYAYPSTAAVKAVHINTSIKIGR